MKGAFGFVSFYVKKTWKQVLGGNNLRKKEVKRASNSRYLQEMDVTFLVSEKT